MQVAVEAAALAPLRDDGEVGLSHETHEQQNVDMTRLSVKVRRERERGRERARERGREREREGELRSERWTETERDEGRKEEEREKECDWTR